MKMMFLAALAGAAITAVPANAAPIVQYDFNGAPGNQASTAATNVAAGLTGLSFSRGSGLTATAGANSINSSGFNVPTDNDFYSFGLNVLSGFTATIDQLVLGSQSSNTGPGSINLLASIDGGAFTTVASYLQTASNLSQTITITPITALSNVTFRLVSANQVAANGGAIGAAGTFRVTNFAPTGANTPVTINGTVTNVVSAVPEPATWAMIIVGFGMAGAAMRRRPARVTFA